MRKEGIAYMNFFFPAQYEVTDLGKQINDVQKQIGQIKKARGDAADLIQKKESIQQQKKAQEDVAAEKHSRW